MVADVDVDWLKQAYLREASGETWPYRKYRLSGRKTTWALINVIWTPEEINDYANKELITLSEEEKLTLLIDAAAEQLWSLYTALLKEKNTNTDNTDKQKTLTFLEDAINIYEYDKWKEIINSLFWGNKDPENKKRYLALKKTLADQYGLQTERGAFHIYNDAVVAGWKTFTIWRKSDWDIQNQAA